MGRESLSSLSPEIGPISHRVIMIICPRLLPPPVLSISYPEKAFVKLQFKISSICYHSPYEKKKQLYIEMSNSFEICLIMCYFT